MSKPYELVVGMALGAGLMYVLDPDRGRRRRALARDQIAHGRSELGEAVAAAAGQARDLGNRARGAWVERQASRHDEPPADNVLEARVRSELGHTIGEPGAVEVAAREGRVTLSGTVLGSELEDVLSTARSVRGVDHVENQLEIREVSDDRPDERDAGS